jgi:hypothetical protein
MNELQREIDRTSERMAKAETYTDARNEWELLSALIRSRPPEEVTRLERELGLCR